MHPVDTRGDLLRTFLADRDEPCPNCGYNLRGVGHDRCPECGQQVCIGVRMVEPRMGLLIGTIAGLMLAVGPASVLTAVFGFFVWFESWRRNVRGWDMVLGYPAAVLVIWGTGIWFLSRAHGRRWFRDRRRSLAWAVLVGAWLASLTALSVWLLWQFRQPW